eukprot:1149349-Pelagomonas_calceolata.AAC.6
MSATHLTGVGQVREVVGQALQHSGVAAELGAGVLAVGVHVSFAVGENTDVVPVRAENRKGRLLLEKPPSQL